MKTPWSNLIHYGVGTATVIVLCIGGVIMLVIVGTAVVLAKIGLFIK